MTKKIVKQTIKVVTGVGSPNKDNLKIVSNIVIKNPPMSVTAPVKSLPIL